MNKSFYERAEELISSSTTILDRPNAILQKEFGLRSDIVSRRVQSLFGKSMTDILREKHLPSREKIEMAILVSNNVKEMQNILNLSPTSEYWKGLLDREFGYSTYQSAKANFVSKMKVKHYNPSRADNLSILISQRLGDGYFCPKRKVLKIDHGIKQFEYLQFKAALLNKAYPESKNVSSVRVATHSQGHKVATYYSGIFSKSAVDKVLSMSIEEMIKEMTPLGWLLWYLDDGHNSFNNEFKTYSLGIASISEEIRYFAHKELLTYGFDFNIQPTMILLQDKVMIGKFINSMLRPFEHIVPDCMKYKIEMKI